MTNDTLRARLAPRILPVVLANITTRYPYHDAHLMREGDVPSDPTVAHPAFGNSFDWHSSVHSHWTALQLLEREQLPTLRSAVDANLSPANIAVETAYLRSHPSYERPYGWAWAFALAARLPLRELAAVVAAAAVRWLSTMPEPVRHGVHGNTAFALGLMYEASCTLGFAELRDAIAQRSRTWYLEDRDWPIRWERSGNDFLSPGLAEADLMRRILPCGDFAAWWSGFLPEAARGAYQFAPVAVPDVPDGHIVHLHGLNLSRAAMLARIAIVLRAANASVRHIASMLSQARTLYDAGVEHAAAGDYLSTHWLPTFAWMAASALDAAQ